MAALAASGRLLDRHYVFRFCSPSRSALHTGRNPIHINVLNSPLASVNLADPIAGFAGLPRNVTALPAMLKAAGYATVQSGKWHLGLATPDHTPLGRGYEQSLSYLDGANDYWTSGTGDWCRGATTDLWASAGPAFGQNNSLACSQASQPPSCRYEDAIFSDFAVAAVAAHDPARPLFLYFAPHNCHLPLEVPAAQLAKFAFIEPNATAAPPPRRSYAAMANLVDAHVGALVDALVARGLWDNTLLVLTADNGGPVFGPSSACVKCDGSAGANNFPLRGGKHSNWEGGVRANALVSGGLLPPAVRGTPASGLLAIEDWYATFAALAGADAVDHRAAAAGLPPVEGFNVWPYLSGAAPASPRAEVWLGADSPRGGAKEQPFVQGLIRADGYKLLYDVVDMDVWTGALYPNETTAAHPWSNAGRDCGTAAAPTCLFNVIADPAEHENLAAAHPGIVAAMAARVAELNSGVFFPDRGDASAAACANSHAVWGGFVGPFLP